VRSSSAVLDGLDFREALRRVISDRLAGVDPARIARRFHRALALGIAGAVERLCEEHGTSIVAISGGVFQNVVLLEDLTARARASGIELWANRAVPPNDAGLSLGQAAIAAVVAR
jgi:hydrogenase maturation protein HypF